MESKRIQTGDTENATQCIAFPAAPPAAPIATTPITQPFLNYRAVNHNEISIMEGDWHLISDKTKQINLTRGIDLADILFGAAIPYAIDIINAWRNGIPADYFPFFVCLFAWMVIKKVEPYFKFLSGGNTEANSIHLNDLKNIIKRIEDNKAK